MVICVEQQDFIKRLTQLRLEKNISAQEMSLDIGQNRGYINSLENGRSFPKMQTFFYICEYLGISPEQFFHVAITAPTKLNELYELEKTLSSEQLDVLISMAKAMKKE